MQITNIRCDYSFLFLSHACQWINAMVFIVVYLHACTKQKGQIYKKKLLSICERNNWTLKYVYRRNRTLCCAQTWNFPNTKRVPQRWVQCVTLRSDAEASVIPNWAASIHRLWNLSQLNPVIWIFPCFNNASKCCKVFRVFRAVTSSWIVHHVIKFNPVIWCRCIEN